MQDLCDKVLTFRLADTYFWHTFHLVSAFFSSSQRMI